MNPRASELIGLLALKPYPEGGYFGDVYRSSAVVYLPDNREQRRALTTIYYLLVAGEHDSWHRVSGDELWHFHEGDTLELIWAEQGAERCTHSLLGEVAELTRPLAVVPGGCWQMARTMGEYTLVGCTVSPGFELDDYKLLRDVPAEAGEIQRRFPELAEFVWRSR